MKTFKIINGPNMNLLGERESTHYGTLSLDEIKQHTNDKLEKFGFKLKLEWFQSNIEGEIINAIHSFHKSPDQEVLIINPAGYSHTSVSILDALKILKKPIVEVHLSQIKQREEYRNHLITSEAANILICGAGIDAYWLGALSQL